MSGNAGRHAGQSIRLPVLDGWRAIAISLVVWHHATMSRYVDQDLYWGKQRFAVGSLRRRHLLRVERTVDHLAVYCRNIGRRARSALPASIRAASSGFFRRFSRCCRWWARWGCSIPARAGQLPGVFSQLYSRKLPGGDYTRHLWSLAVEEHFYLLWPALLVWLCRKDRTGRPVAYLSIFFGLWRVLCRAERAYVKRSCRA